MKKMIIILCTLLLSKSVFAETQEWGKGVIKRTQNINEYGYEFDDDPLNAGGFGPNDTLLKIRPKAARVTLIRPRTSFVPEILKSIQDII